MSKTSIIWKISTEQLQKIFDESKSYKEVLIKLGFKSFSANRKTLNKRLETETINYDTFNKNVENNIKNNKKNLQSSHTKLTEQDFFKKNCTHSRTHIKKYIIKNKILEYKCKKCNNTGDWNGETLSLQLEHINGINNDNTLENLCFLCPNCHSQTLTWGNKRNKKAKIKKIHNRKRKFTVDVKDLEKMINNMPIVKVASYFKVTGNAIRRRCKYLGIEIPKFPPGYWIKKHGA